MISSNTQKSPAPQGLTTHLNCYVGGLEIIGGIAITVLSLGALAPLGGLLIAAGAGTLLTGIGTAILGGGSDVTSASGASMASRNPVATWVIPYGRTVVGGSLVFYQSFGDNDKYTDMVFVLAAIPCEAVDALLFDKQIIQMSTNGGAFSAVGGSFTPLQQTVNVKHISRSNGVVTALLQHDIPLLVPGDYIQVQNITGDYTLNGRFPVAEVPTHSNVDGGVTFTYLSGGPAATVDNEGQAVTQWPDYGKKIHMEVLLGDHSSTFPGMLLGTGNDNDSTSDHSIIAPNNPWNASHKLLGRCCVFLRLHFNDKYFSGGIPTISFLIRGKKDILDPRTSPVTYGYTENAALCTADFVSNPVFGYKAAYGTEIPTAPLIAAANICDEAVNLAAGGTEPRYALNGKFDLSQRRGDILRNMLTACGGRFTDYGGQFIIWPAAWNGASPATAPGVGQMSGAFTWKSTVSIRDLFNGVKGTFICQANNWQAGDFPPYAQDSTHGYSMGFAWSSVTNYGVGVDVVFNRIGYVSILTGTNHQPDTSPTYWAVSYQDLNLIADGGDRRWLDIQLPFTISSPTAQRLAKIELLRRRHQGTGTFRFNMAGYSITVLDVIELTLPFLGWNNKLLEVLKHRFVLDKQNRNGIDVTVLGTEIDVQETDAEVYDWSDTEELTPQGYQQPVLNLNSTASPTNLALESDTSTTVATPSGLADTILVTWTPPLDAHVLNGGHIEVQYQPQENYSAGTISATNGNAAVTGSGTTWTIAMEEGDITINGLTQQVLTVLSPTSLVLTAVFGGTTGSGQLYSIRFGDTWIGLPSVNPTVTQVNINGVVDGQQYIVQIRAVNAGDFPSDWIQAGPITANGARQPLPWKPFSDVAAITSLYRPSGFVFGLAQGPGPSGAATLTISGWPSINTFSPNLAAPPIIDSYAVVSANIGGTIALNYGDYIGVVVAYDAGGLISRISNPTNFAIAAVAVKITFGVTWPANTVAYEVFVGLSIETLQPQGRVTATPASITLTLCVIGLGYGLPDPHRSCWHIIAQQERHSGVLAANVLSVTASTVVLGLPAGLNFTSGQFNGRALVLLGRVAPADLPILGNPITGTDVDGTLHVTSPWGSFLQPGDLVTIQALADTHTATAIGDSAFANIFSPGGTGLAVNAEAGSEVWIMSGTGAGQVRDIASNTGTVITPKLPFSPPPDATSQFIVVAKTHLVDIPTSPDTADTIPQTMTAASVIALVDATALQGLEVFVRVLPQDAFGNDADFAVDEYREIYVNPVPSSVAAFLLEVAGTVGIQSDAAGLMQLPNDYQATGVTVRMKSGPVGANLTVQIYAFVNPTDVTDTLWMTLTILDGTASIISTAAQVAAAVVIPDNTNVRLSITAVGSTFPGSGLTVFFS